MRRALLAFSILAWVAIGAGAQIRDRGRVDPASDPKAFDITTRADLEDSMRRVSSLRAQLADARSDKERETIRESILRLCQEELNKQSNASGAIVVERSTDPLTPNMAVRWTGAFSMIENTILALGADGLALYEKIYGPRADALVQDALNLRDLAALANLNRRFGLTQAGLRASALLAATWWERGELSRAARALERTLHAPELLTPQRRAALCAWLSHCYRDLGERANISRLIKLPDDVRGQQVDEAGQAATLSDVLTRDLQQARDTGADTLSARGIEWPGGNYSNTGLPPLPADYSQTAWARNLPRLAADMQGQFMNYPQPIVPPFMPLFDGDLLYVNTGDRLVAYDLVGGGSGEGPQWSCKPFVNNAQMNWRTGEPDPAMILPVSSYRGTVYTAIENPLSILYHERNADPMFGLFSHYPQVRRALCAVDAATGRLLWKLGGLYEGSQDDMTSFLYALVVDGVLYAVGSRVPGISEVFLYALEPSTGEILWNLRLCYGQQETTMFGRPARTPFPSLCAVAGGEMYLCTNLGGIVAVNLTRRCIDWITRYEYIPRPITKYTETYYRDVTWYNNPTIYTEVEGRPYVLAAPADSETLFALDAGNGEVLWRIDRNALLTGGRAVVGVRAGKAYVASDGGFEGMRSSVLHSIDIARGVVGAKPLTVFSVAGTRLGLAGRPCMAGNRVFWPGQTGRDCAIAEIDLDTMRVVSGADAPDGYAGWTYSLFCNQGILYSVSGANYTQGNSQLAVRFNQQGLLDSARKTALADQGNVDAVLRCGLLTLRLGDRTEALKFLKLAFDGASVPPTNTRVRDGAARALIGAYLERADAALAARRYPDVLAQVAAAREYALIRSQRADCFTREERALVAQGDKSALRALYEGLVANEPDFGVGEDPEIPASVYGLIRLSLMIEGTEPAKAAAMYQQIQDSPPRLAWQGVKLRNLALERLRALITANGRGVYKPQDDKAAELLAAKDAEQLPVILQRYPLSLAADDAALRLAESALARNDGTEAANLLLAALEDSAQRPRRAEMLALLAISHGRAGEKLRARLVASRALREFPDGKLTLGGKEQAFRDVLGPLAGVMTDGGGARTLPRLPAQPAELWQRPWEERGFTRVPTHPASPAVPRFYLSERQSQGFTIVAIDAPSSEVVWSKLIDVVATAVYETDRGALFETQQGFNLIDDSGHEVWSLATGGTPMSVSFDGGMIVYGTRYQNRTTRRTMIRVQALDAGGGGGMWEQEFEATNLRWTAQTPAGVLLLLTGNEQRLHLLNAESGVVLKSATLDLAGQVAASPVLTDGVAWFVDVFGNIRGLSAETLAQKTALSTGQRGATLLRAGEGRVCAVGSEGACCFEVASAKQAWIKTYEPRETFRGAEFSSGVYFVFTRDNSGRNRVTGYRQSAGGQAMRYTLTQANETDRIEVMKTAPFEGGVAGAWAVYSIVQGALKLSSFRLVLLASDGAERFSYTQEALDTPSNLAQIAVIDGHLLLACGNITRCFGLKQ